MITLGISQRETERVLEALGVKTSSGDPAREISGGGKGSDENPRRIFRRALYVAIGGLITAGVGWAGKQAAEGLLKAARAEISVHRTVATHTHQLDDHEQRLQYLQERAKAQVVLPADASAQLAKLITLLEADAKARAAKGAR